MATQEEIDAALKAIEGIAPSARRDLVMAVIDAVDALREQKKQQIAEDAERRYC